MFSMRATCAHGFALLWQYSNILCISRFTDDVLFVHNGQEYRRLDSDSVGSSMDLSP